VYEKVLRIYGQDGGRRLHDEGFHKLYASPSIITVMMVRRIRLAGHVSCIGKMRNAHKILIRKPDRKRPHGRPRCR
jgi:hypothetical protein